MTSVVIGVIVVLLSFIGLAKWWSEFVLFLKGFMPISFLLCGLVAVIAGISGLIPRSYEKLQPKNKKSDE